MRIGVRTWSGTYVWEWSWDPARLEHADLRFALKTDPSTERDVERVEQLPTALDGVLVCRPGGATLTVGDEIVQDVEFRMANYRFPYRLLVDGEHRFDWVLVYTWAVGTADGDVLAAWAGERLPYDGQAVAERVQGELWPAGGVEETHGSVDVNGGVTLSDGSHFERPVDEAVLVKLVKLREYKAAAAFLGRVAEDCRMEVDGREGTVTNLRLTRPLPALLGALDTSKVDRIELVEVSAEDAAAIRDSLSAPPRRAKIDGPEGLKVAMVLEDVKLLEIEGADPTLDALVGLAGRQAHVTAESWPPVDVIEHVLANGPTIVVPDGVVRDNGLTVSASRAADVLPVRCDEPWALAMAGIKPEEDPFDAVLTVAGQLRSLSLGGALSGRLPSPPDDLQLTHMSLAASDLCDDDVDAVLAWVNASSSLAGLDVSRTRLTGAGVKRLSVVPKLNARDLNPKPPAAWSAGGLRADELPAKLTQGQDRKFGGGDFPWEVGAASLQEAVGRAAASLGEVARAGTAPMQHKNVVGACDRLVKASKAKTWKTAITRMVSASKKLAPKGHDTTTRAFAELTRSLAGSIALIHAAWILDEGVNLSLDEHDWERAQLDFEPRWLLHLSRALVRIAGCTANWDNEVAPTTHGDPEERQRLLEAWSAL